MAIDFHLTRRNALLWELSLFFRLRPREAEIVLAAFLRTGCAVLFRGSFVLWSPLIGGVGVGGCGWEEGGDHERIEAIILKSYNHYAVNPIAAQSRNAVLSSRENAAILWHHIHDMLPLSQALEIRCIGCLFLQLMDEDVTHLRR